MTNRGKFISLVSAEKTDTLERNKERIKNRAMLRESQGIALKVLLKLDDIGWSQKKLALMMKVTPQQISKIVSGKENLTIDTQQKLQEILDIPILASYYEKLHKEAEEVILQFETEEIYESPDFNDSNYGAIIQFKTRLNTKSSENLSLKIAG